MQTSYVSAELNDIRLIDGGSVAEWLACVTQVQKGLGNWVQMAAATLS